MRRLGVAIAGVLALTAAVLVAAPAHAAPASSHWAVTMISDLDPPVCGDTVEFSASLQSDSGPIAGKSVTLLTRTVSSGSPFTPVATVITESDGTARASVKVCRNTAYRWQFAGDAEFTASTTGTLVQAVASKVVAHGSDLTLNRHQLLAVFGKAYPNKVGNRVTLWLGKVPRPLVQQPDPVLLAVGKIRDDGSFRLLRSFSSTGYKRLFVKVAGDTHNGDGFSNYVVVKVG